jgi:hypothetical protein
MSIRTSDDLARTMHRLALLERRLERLETLLRDRPAPGDALEREGSEDAAVAARARVGTVLDFPEIRLQLAEPPAAASRPAAPAVCHVRAAIEAYPHLLQPLCTLWGHPEFERFVTRLIVDERGGRKGFAADVIEELLFLAQLNHEFCPSWGPRDPWADSQFIGDRL